MATNEATEAAGIAGIWAAVRPRIVALLQEEGLSALLQVDEESFEAVSRLKSTLARLPQIDVTFNSDGSISEVTLEQLLAVETEFESTSDLIAQASRDLAKVRFELESTKMIVEAVRQGFEPSPTIPNLRRAPIGDRLRFQVLHRDNFMCVYCGRGAPEVELHVDHRTPVSLGGTNDPSNLVSSCEDCNLGKSNRFVT